MKIFDQVSDFEKELDNVPDLTPAQVKKSPIEALKPYKGAIIIVLNIIKIFTGKRADKKIDQLISILDFAL